MAMMFDDSSTFIAIGRWLCVMCEVRMGSLYSQSSFNMAIRKAPPCMYQSTWPYERWSRSQGFLNFIVKEFRAVTLVYIFCGVEHLPIFLHPQKRWYFLTLMDHLKTSGAEEKV